MKEDIKVIIVDDHQIFRKGLSLQLKEVPSVQVVGEANSGKEFIDILEDHDADVVLMDIKMPEMTGVEATKKALKKNPNLKILALSMFGEEEYLQNMLDAGAKGFLLKNIDIVDLERAINSVMDGKNFFSDEMLTILTRTFVAGTAPKKGQKARRNKSNNDGLTNREVEVLQLICRGMSNQEIAKTLELSPRTVDGHRANIINKTQTKNTVSLVTYAIKKKIVEL